MTLLWLNCNGLYILCHLYSCYHSSENASSVSHFYSSQTSKAKCTLIRFCPLVAIKLRNLVFHSLNSRTRNIFIFLSCIVGLYTFSYWLALLDSGFSYVFLYAGHTRKTKSSYYMCSYSIKGVPNPAK